MPRKAAHVSEADKHAAEGGAVAVDRALFVLSAFRLGDTSIGLAELAQRSGLYKSTLLRLLASLEHAALVQRLPDGRYSLGPEVARLNAVYAASILARNRGHAGAARAGTGHARKRRVPR